ncbi:MAG: VTT domain-containing protein [Candidatus Lokiarchaeota archaeon]|nr:VTT domain-containing protein [Candidatus Lokiarchaeota archaeon]
MKIKRMDFIFFIILGIITIISIDFILNESHRVFIENISSIPPFQDLASGLLITFLVCLIGNLLPIPTPYTFVVCFSSLPFLQTNLLIPVIVALIASLGSLVGELGGYFVGRGASAFISEEQSQNLKKYQKFLLEHPKTAPFMIFLFGFTPLNDDFITIPLGIIKYSFLKTIFWCWLGKLSLMLVFSYNIINICSLLGGENWILSIISMYLITIILYIIIKIDLLESYNKLIENFRKKREKS